MVETTYMQRDPRRDHGFIIPDPVLSNELGVPNACNRCHEDQTIEWAVEAWEQWYGDEEKHAPRRARTRAVARAYAGDPDAATDLIGLLENEKATGWRASLLDLAGNLAPESSGVIAAANSLIGHDDPLVRAAAIRVLSNEPSAREKVRAALSDPVRLVRLDAAVALAAELDAGSPERAALDEYFTLSLEHPVARLRRGQDLFQQGRHAEGIALVMRAIELDPLSAPFPETLGFMYNATGQPAQAAQQFEKATSLAPESDVLPYYAALAWAESGNMQRAENMFRESARRNPDNGRVLYNLGLLQAQTGRTDEAIATLLNAERADPRDPGIPYALATILIQQNLRDEAIAAANRALAIDPSYQPAVGFLRVVDSAGE
jgi:tetratricopeptide (TPR) repeat protein